MDPIEPWVDRDELRRLADALLAAPAKPTPDPPNDATYGEQFVGFTGDEPAPQPAAPAKPKADEAARQAAADMARAAEAHQGPGEPPQDLNLHHKAKKALSTARQIAQRGGLLDAEKAHDPDERTKPTPAPAAKPVAAQLTQVTPVPGAPPQAPTSPPPSPSPRPATSTATPFLERLKSYGAWLRQSAQAKAFFLVDREGGVLLDEVQSPKLQQVARTLAQASRTANRQAGAAAIGNLHVKLAAESILEVVPVATRYGPLILGIILDQPLSPEDVATVARALQRVVDGNPTT